MDFRKKDSSQIMALTWSQSIQPTAKVKKYSEVLQLPQLLYYVGGGGGGDFCVWLLLQYTKIQKFRTFISGEKISASERNNKKTNNFVNNGQSAIP